MTGPTYPTKLITIREKDQQEALKRGGVHRVKDKDLMPSTVHVVGIGKAGAAADICSR